MSFDDFDDFDDDFDEPTPEIEMPDVEEIFQSDTSMFMPSKERLGAERLGLPVLNKQAKARLIAARSKQLELGAKSTIPSARLKSMNLEKIALQEIDERVIPIKIVRKYADGTYEVWTIKDFKYIIPG